MQKLIFGSLLLAGSPSLVTAETAVSGDSTDLPEMVVTATRSEIDKNELATASSVYTRKDIERLQAKTLPELLKGTTGIDLVQQGGDGKITSLFMRGTNSDHVLVLVDGIKFGSATTNTAPFETLPLDQIERVEIIRGPQSSLYGSEAIGGVIQIFTRKGGQSEKPAVSLDAGGGNYGTLRTAGAVNGKLNNSWYSFGASHYNTEGFNAHQIVPGPFGYNEADSDGYYNTGLNARFGHRFDNHAEVEATFMRGEGRTEYDGNLDFFGKPQNDTTNKTQFINQIASLSGSMDFLENWRSTIRLGHSLDYNDQFSPNGAFFSRFNTNRWNVSWLNQITMTEDFQMVGGIDYRLDQVDSSDLDTFHAGFDTYKEKSRYDVGIFNEIHGRLFDDHFLNASLRYDENEAFGNAVTGNFGWRYNSPIGISPFASFGNAFKAPTFNELYWPNTGFGGGNPNLKAEESTTFEVGLAGNHKWIQWEFRAYHTDVDNLISSWPPKNVNKAQIDGLEAEISTQLLGWNSKLSMNLLNPRDRITNQRLDGRADKMLSFDLSKSFGPVDFGTFVQAQDGRTASFTGHAAGYVTVDLRTAYHFDKNWMISAKLNNLLDKQYQLVNTYNTADRNFFVSIHYNN